MRNHSLAHFIFSLCLYLAISVSAWPGNSLAADADDKHGGELIFGVSSVFPGHFNSAIHSGSSIGRPAAQIFASPLRFDRHWQPQPYLAEKWDISENGLSVTLHLVKTATFHDGMPVTSKDVAFSVKVVKENHPFKPMFAPVLRVDTPDPHTAVIRLSKPHPAILLAMSSTLLPILPKHIYGDGRDIRTHPANKVPVGCGPYKFVRSTPGKELVLDRYEGYFLKGYPYLDRIRFIYLYPSEFKMALENGTVHMTAFGQLPLFADETEQTDFIVTTKGYEAIGPLHWLAFNLRKKPFDDLRVRQAFAYAIDRRFLAKRFGAIGTPVATGPISPDSPFYSKNVEKYDVDVKQANSLLDQAGYPRDEHGKRFTIFFDFEPSQNWVHGDLGDFLRHDLFRKIGVEMKLYVSADFKEWARRVSTGEFTITLDNVYNWGDPVIGVHRTYDSGNIRKGLIWSNTQGYRNPKVDALIEAAGSELDFDKRKALYAEFQKIVVRDLPVFYLWKTPFYTIHSKNLMGIDDSIWGAMSPMDRVYWQNR